MTWKTKSGKVLDINQMSSEHIENTLHYLEKKYGSEFFATGKNEIVDQYHYMKRVLGQRILDNYHHTLLEEVDPINLFRNI